jgi:hypothetical protein
MGLLLFGRCAFFFGRSDSAKKKPAPFPVRVFSGFLFGSFSLFPHLCSE